MRHTSVVFRCALLGLLSLLVACSSQSSAKTTTPTPTPTPPPGPVLQACPLPPGDPLNEVRFWVRGQIAVSAVLSAPGQPVSESAILKAVNTLVTTHGDPALQPVRDNSGLPAVVQVGRTATAFLTIANPTLRCDDNVRAAVTAINAALIGNVNGGPPTFAGGFIAGASPNWYSAASPYDGGSDAVHGSPDNLPGGTTLQLPLTQAPPLTNPASIAFVLDTGYPVVNGAQPEASCGSDNHPCMPKAEPLNADLLGSGYRTYVGSTLASVLTESDLALPDETTFEDFNLGHAFKVQDHGLFISELIHHLAPKTQVVLLRDLNNYGMGDLHTTLFELQSIINDPEQFGVAAVGKIPTVISLSLNFGPSISCFDTDWQQWHDQSDVVNGQPFSWHNYNETACGQTNVTQATIAQNAPLYSTIGETLQAMIASSQGNISVVAAAGNDDGDYAHLPAGFCGVIAAGATVGTTPPSDPTDHGQMAAFANLPFWPNQGCLQEPTDASSPVGTYQPNAATYAFAQGVNLCSLYFQHNLTGTGTANLAQWSGTSFATALVSGNIAATPSLATLASGQLKLPSQSQPCQ